MQPLMMLTVMLTALLLFAAAGASARQQMLQSLQPRRCRGKQRAASASCVLLLTSCAKRHADVAHT